MTAPSNEIKIPVLWGHIQVKTWGNSENPSVLLIHGKQDNAGSFDLLIPRLPSSFFYICMDTPGHGKSSPLPQYIALNIMFYVASTKYVAEYFKWTKVKIICHSLGVDIANNFALIYTEMIDWIIALDYVVVWPVEPHTYSYHHKIHVEGLQRIFNRTVTNQPALELTYEDALQRLMKNRPTKICEAGARNMLNRAIAPTEGNKFALTTDPRLKYVYFQPISKFDIGLLVKESNFRFPYLVLLASETCGDLIETREPIIHALKQNPNCRIYILQGNHDLHNNNPELVAKYIIKFLDKLQKNTSKI